MLLDDARGIRTRPHEQSLWPVALIFVVPALIIAAMFYEGHVLGRVKPSVPAPLHRLGVVHTRFGVADIVCGGDLTDGCESGEVALRFTTDAPGILAYFGITPAELATPAGMGRVVDQDRFDRLMRGIAGDPPPGFARWVAFE